MGRAGRPRVEFVHKKHLTVESSRINCFSIYT